MKGTTRWILLTVAMALVIAPPLAGRQPEAPNLDRDQRATLQAMVAAVDRAASSGTQPADWPVHTLRASDGSHYVAFSLISPPGIAPNRPVALYVRLATRRIEGVTTTTIERSAVAEWLAGQRSTPLQKERGIAFGEMPTYGAGAIAARGPTTISQGLQLLDLERERARERREERDRERKASLEGESQRPARPLLPFEDFDLNAVSAADSGGAAVIRRSLTAGPGEYVLSVAWADPKAKDPARAVTVVQRPLNLPIASTSEFGLSSVIIADSVGVQQTPLGSDEQSKRPYSIGPIEIVPARDAIFTSDEPLSVVVQVINPRAGADGKPDVAVGFRLTRTTGARQENVGILNPQVYDRSTLPLDFDVAKGHPIFAAVEVPLHTFKRGTYRMQVMAEDRLGGASTTADATFTVVATPAVLLREAPSVAPSFQRDALLEPSVVAAMVDSLRPPRPSPGLAAALEAARGGRFIDLVREDAVDPSENGIRAVLRALALYSLGDTTTAVALRLRQGAEAGASAAAIHTLTGGLRAFEGNDREALAAWHTAIDSGLPRTALAPLIVDAYLRQGDNTRAGELAETTLAARPGDPEMTRRLAATHIAAGQIALATPLLEQRLQQQPDDMDGQWLLLHALFSEYARGEGAAKQPSFAARFKDVAARYIAGNGRHASLASEWLAVVQ
jgi:tetratricopeptide repeat protein